MTKIIPRIISGYNYAYDLNGNRASDGRTALEFSYNLLNLPCEVRDSQDNMQMRYTYLSDGTKVSAVDAAGDGLLYRGNFVYEKDGQNISLESIAWDEGRIRRKAYHELDDGELFEVGDTLAVTDTLPGLPLHPRNPFTPGLLAKEGQNGDIASSEPVTEPTLEFGDRLQDQWFVKDHLGNVRSVIDLTRSATMPADSVILEQNDYLPYGTKSSTSSLSTDSAFRYRYAGKEEQRFGTFDSQLLDFGARYYDPWTCQWTAVDPMAEDFLYLSSNIYCGSNPINIVDYYGLNIYTINEDGKVELYLETDDDYDTIYASYYDPGEGPIDLSANSVRIYDQSIMSALAKGETLLSSTNKKDMKNLFYYAANNFSDREWGLYYNHDSCELITNGKASSVSSSLDGVTWKIHSHPNEPATDKAEIESMGYWTYDGSAYDSNGKLLDNKAQWHESTWKNNDATNYSTERNIPSYVYFPVSGNVYKLTKQPYLPHKMTPR